MEPNFNYSININIIELLYLNDIIKLIYTLTSTKLELVLMIILFIYLILLIFKYN